MSYNILVLEDHPLQGTNTQQELIKKGYKVDLITNGREALQKFQPGLWDAAIIDFDLGNSDLDGFSVLVELTKKGFQGASIFLTNYVEGINEKLNLINEHNLKIINVISKSNYSFHSLALELAQVLNADDQFSAIGHLDLRKIKQPNLKYILTRIDECAKNGHNILLSGGPSVGKTAIGRYYYACSGRIGGFLRLDGAEIDIIPKQLEEAHGGVLFISEPGDRDLTRFLRPDSLSSPPLVVVATTRKIEDVYPNILEQIDPSCRFVIPPLCDRPEDLRELASYLYDRAAQWYGRREKRLDEATLQKLLRERLPGNLGDLIGWARTGSIPEHGLTQKRSSITQKLEIWNTSGTTTQDLFNDEQVDELLRTVVEVGLWDSPFQRALRDGIDQAFFAELPSSDPCIPVVFLRTTICALGRSTKQTTQGELPALRWLKNAILLTTSRQEQNVFQRAYNYVKARINPEMVAVKVNACQQTIRAPAAVRIVASDYNLLGIEFFSCGQKAASSVGKITINNAHGAQSGTAWLLADRIIITNHHLCSTLPIKGSWEFASFEIETEKGINSYTCLNLLFASAVLDYALIELKETPLCEPLRISPRRYFGFDWTGWIVNLITHSENGRKLLAVRGNEVADVSLDSLWYASENQSTQSGSPILDDRWDVLALHKASHFKPGYLVNGRPMAVVNQAVLLDAIMADLKKHNNVVWGRVVESQSQLKQSP